MMSKVLEGIGKPVARNPLDRRQFNPKENKETNFAIVKQMLEDLVERRNVNDRVFLAASCLYVSKLPARTWKGLQNLIKGVRYLIFDFDGTLAEAGLETANVKMTVDEFLTLHAAEVTSLRNKLILLGKFGMKVIICTGRSFEFVKKILGDDLMIPEYLCYAVVGESGATIHLNKGNGKWKLINPRCVNKESLRLLSLRGDELIEKLEALGFKHEKGKLYTFSFNAPIELDENGKPKYDENGNPIVMNISIARSIAEDLLRKIGLYDFVVVKNSATAVDISAIGAEKLKALKQVIKDFLVVYLGDEGNDNDATLAAVMIGGPANSSDSFLQESFDGAYCMIAPTKHLYGTSHIIGNILKLRQGKKFKLFIPKRFK